MTSAFIQSWSSSSGVRRGRADGLGFGGSFLETTRTRCGIEAAVTQTGVGGTECTGGGEDTEGCDSGGVRVSLRELRPSVADMWREVNQSCLSVCKSSTERGRKRKAPVVQNTLVIEHRIPRVV